MIKKERLKIVEELEGLKSTLQDIKDSTESLLEDIKDCEIISNEIDKMIDYVSNNSKIDGQIIIKIRKLTNITKILKTQIVINS